MIFSHCPSLAISSFPAYTWLASNQFSSSSLISPIYAPYFQLLVRFLFPTRECDTVDYIFRKMGLKYRTYLEGRKVYGCQNCRSHLANSDGLISKVNVLGSLASIKISTNTRLLTAIPRSTWPSLFISLCSECIRRTRKGETNDYRKAHYRYCILLPMRHGSWLAICKWSPPAKSQLLETHTNQSLQRLFQIKAFEDSQKYKEGACILEKALLTTVK